MFAQGTSQEARDSISISSDSVANKKYTNAGTYEYTLTITNDKYVFIGGQKTATVSFTITKKALNYNMSELALNSNPTYKGSAILLSDLNHNIDTDLFDISLDGEYVDANTFDDCYLTISPKQVTTTNYTWKNGTEISYVDNIAFHIEKSTTLPSYSNKANDILNNVVKTYEYSPMFSFERVISEVNFTEEVEQWLTANLNYSLYASMSIATENIPNGESVVSNAQSESIDVNTFAGGEYYVWVDYNPNAHNYEGSTKIKIKVVITKATQNLSATWEIANNQNVPVKDSYYTNILNFASSLASEKTYYKEKKTDAYVEVPKSEQGYHKLSNIGYYKSVAVYEIDLNSYDVVINKEYNGDYNETENGIEFVSEWRIYDPNVVGKQFTFADLKILKEDGSELTTDEFAALTEDIKNITDGIKTSNVGKTANCDANGKVSGTCDFGNGSFDELINPTEPDLAPEPYYYTYSSTSENSVEMFVKDGDTVIEASKLVGNLVGDTLTLIMQLPTEEGIPAGYVWQFTFTKVEAE